MKQVLAILVDSYHEAVARKSLVVMLVLCTLPIVFFASLSFELADPDEAVAAHVAELEDRVLKPSGGMLSFGRDDPEEEPALRFSDVEVGGEGPLGDWGPDLADAWTFRIEGDLAVGERRREAWLTRQARDTMQPPPEDARWETFLPAYFGDLGFSTVELQVTDQAIGVALLTTSAKALAGGYRLRFLWGLQSLELERQSAGDVVVGLQAGMAVGLVGFVGILLAVVLTGAMVPSMLEKGTLDLLLARPIGRAKLLLSKYVGGLWFVAILATYAVVGSWIALRLATGFGSSAVLIAIPAMIGAFALLYSISVWAGVLTRSSMVAILAACGTWFLSTVIDNLRGLFVAFGQDFSPWVGQTLDAVYWAFPKLGVFDKLVVTRLTEAELPGVAAGGVAQALGPDDGFAGPLLANLAFAIVMLGLAVWTFRRRDY